MLTLTDVHAGYDDVPVLFGVSLTVEPGEIVAIVGANGAGKSTILRTISGLVRPRSGRLLFEGKDLARLPVHAITAAGIAHVPEGRRLFAKLTVMENLTLGAYTRPDPARRAENLELIFGLFPILHERRQQLAGTMSGGEQQMLAIGRGLMLSPRLLMLDEPSVGIAPKLVAEILAAIQRINRSGTTVLLVEQNVTEALDIAHRAYVLQTGAIVAHGPAETIAKSDLVRQAYLGM